MDGWNCHENLNGPFRILIQDHTFFHVNRYSYPEFEDDMQFLEKKMTNETTIDGIPVRKLYVGNIPIETRNCDLFHMFKKFGVIVSIFISRKNKVYYSCSLTFGFVTFKNTEDAARAIAHPKFAIGAMELIVKAADSWHQPLVNPDGSIEYRLSVIHNMKIEKENKNDEGNESEGDDIDDIVGAVGGITISCVSSLEAKVCPISRLNDDCLENIFSYLPLHCRITTSNVCKRWQTIISNMLRKIESFNFHDYFMYREFDMDQTLVIFEKIGPNLKKIVCNFEQKFCRGSSSVISSVIARYCKNLEVLEVMYVDIPERSLTFLSKQCSNLRKVTFKSCGHLTDNDLASLFSKKNNKIEEINLMYLSDIKGKCLICLQPPVSRITIEECSSIRPEFLMLGMRNIKDTLTSLTLKNNSSHDCYDLNRIADIVPNLKYLTISYYRQFFICSVEKIHSLGKFTQLKSLNISNNYLVDDSVISVIVNGCKLLKSLNLSGRTGSLSEIGISKLCHIYTLEELNISRLEQVNDETMQHFSVISPPPRLKKLICSSCKNLSDKGALSILSSCKELEYFDLRSCPLIRNKTITKAMNIVKNRENDLLLKMMIYGTSVDVIGEDESSFSHPLLTLDFTDDSHLSKKLNSPFHICGNANFICDGTDCDSFIGFEDDSLDLMSESDEDVDDFLFDYYDDDDVSFSDFNFE